MRNYFHRVHDYMNDPFFPAEGWWVIFEALWACLWNSRLYNDD